MWEDLERIDLKNLPYKTKLGDFEFTIKEFPLRGAMPFVIVKNEKLGLSKVFSSPDVKNEAGYACMIKIIYELYTNGGNL